MPRSALREFRSHARSAEESDGRLSQRLLSGDSLDHVAAEPSARPCGGDHTVSQFIRERILLLPVGRGAALERGREQDSQEAESQGGRNAG